MMWAVAILLHNTLLASASCISNDWIITPVSRNMLKWATLSIPCC